MEKAIHRYEKRHLFQPREKGRVLGRFFWKRCLEKHCEKKKKELNSMSYLLIHQKCPKTLRGILFTSLGLLERFCITCSSFSSWNQLLAGVYSSHRWSQRARRKAWMHKHIVFYLLKSHWPRQVTWLNSTSSGREGSILLFFVCGQNWKVKG